MWERTVRDLAMQRKVAEPKEKFDPKTRLDELLRIATDRGLTGRLLLPPKGKAAEKKAVMIGRLRFDSLVKAMSDVEITFADFLEMVRAFDRTAYEMRDRRIFDHLRAIADRPSVPLTEFAEAVHKGLTVNPPDTSGLLQTLAYEKDGGVDEVFADYYRRKTHPDWLRSVQHRADCVVHYDEEWRVCHVGSRDGRHSGAISCAAWSNRSASGTHCTLATGSMDGTVRLWRCEGAAVCEAMHRGHTARVTAVAFTSEGSTLLSSAVDGTVRLWSVGGAGARRPPTVLGQPAAVEAVAAAPTSPFCAATDRNFVHVWSLTELGRLGQSWLELDSVGRRAAAELGLTAAQWDAGRTETEERARALCTRTCELYGTRGRRWQEASAVLGGVRAVLRSERGAVLCLSWATPQLLVGGCEGCVALVWSVDASGGATVLRVAGTGGPVRCIAAMWLGDGLVVAGGAGRQLAVWRAVTPQQDPQQGVRSNKGVVPDAWTELTTEDAAVTAVDWTDDGSGLAVVREPAPTIFGQP